MKSREIDRIARQRWDFLMNQSEQNQGGNHSRIQDEIFEKYDSFIRSVIQFAAQNPEDKEDIYQEVFLFLSQRDDFDKIQNIEGFLYRVVINKARDFQRSKRRYENNLKKYFRSKPPDTEVQQGGIVQELIDDEDMNGMLDLIRERLSKKEAAALLTRLQHPDDIDAAARELKVKKTTVIHNASMGLTKLRSIFKKTERAHKEGDKL